MPVRTFVRPGTETSTGVPRVETVRAYVARTAAGTVLLDTGLGAANDDTDDRAGARRLRRVDALTVRRAGVTSVPPRPRAREAKFDRRESCRPDALWMTADPTSSTPARSPGDRSGRRDRADVAGRQRAGARPGRPVRPRRSPAGGGAWRDQPHRARALRPAGGARPRMAAVRLSGVVSHQSAARLWGIAQLDDDRRPHVTVAPSRARVARASAVLHWMSLAARDVENGVTVPLRTVLDIGRTSSFRAGLACADSALRERLMLPSDLVAAAALLTNRGSRTARRVAEHADARAGSVLESALRAIVIDLELPGFVPQLQIDDGGFRARVDLGHEVLRIVLEADSFEHHGHRTALARDCHRYSELTSRGWLVLRFAWEHVIFDPAWVSERILDSVTLRG